MQCSSHIYSLIYVKFVYSASCQMVDGSDFISGTYVYIASIEATTYVAYMSTLVGIFLSGTYLAITCEVGIAVHCVMAHELKIVGSICPFNITALFLCMQCYNHICSVINQIVVQ